MKGSEDIKKLNQLFEDYKSRFISFANSYVQDLTVAEDFVMEAFMDYWESEGYSCVKTPIFLPIS